MTKDVIIHKMPPRQSGGKNDHERHWCSGGSCFTGFLIAIHRKPAPYSCALAEDSHRMALPYEWRFRVH
jgi:hypothetical protein